ncbi:MAG TPA: hypothetical protein VLQ93_07750 [Myxococcaceae bacterium]|nr:hypothetical protein [Myxococcaceae bacterium]
MGLGFRKVLSATGMLLLGDALAHFIYPRGHLEVWSWPKGPAFYQRALEALRSKRSLVMLSAAEVAAGFGLVAFAQRPS